MLVRCLHCHVPIELPGDSDLCKVVCLSCGGSFSLVGDDTLSWNGQTTKKLGPFELVEQVGGGAFGTVWKARDPLLDRTVAIKVPRKGQLDATEAEQFLREARHAAQLRHPNIVAVHEVGRDGDTVFIVSDFVQGATLDDWLTGRSLSPREAAQLCVEIAAALHHAHEARVIHRDLKPGNVMLDLEGHPHLMDFGLSRREVGEVTMTVDGQVMGTPAYMSPEQAGGKAHEADRRSDVYSLGVILFRLLTGELPYRGSAQMLIVQKQREDSPSLRKLNSRIPRDLDTICLKCLEREPRKRYATAQALAHDLRRWLTGEPIHARPITKAARAWRWCKRNPAVTLLTIAIAAVLLVGVGVSSYFAVARSKEAKAAKIAQGEAEEAQCVARAAQGTAEEERRAAETAERKTRRQLYISDMSAARQAWDENNVGRVKELLKRHMHDGCEDPRRLEWYYLWRLCAVADRADSIKQPGRARRIAVSQAKDRLAVGCGNGVVIVWNLKTLQQQATFRTTGSTISPEKTSHRHIAVMPEWEWLSVAFSPDGEILACPTADYTGVVLQDLRNGTSRSFGRHREVITALAFAPDGRFVATGSSDGVVILHDLGANSSRELIRHEQRVSSLVFSTDSSRLAIGVENEVEVVEVSTCLVLQSFNEHNRRVWSIAYSPDGKYLASASADHTVVVRNRATKESRVLAGHTDEVRSIAFSADGSLLASGSRDDTAALWDVAAGARIEIFRGHSHNVESVAFYQVGDTTKLLTGSSDGFVKRWNIGEASANVLRCKPDVGQLVLLPDSHRIVTLDSEQEQVRVWTPEGDSWCLTSLQVGERVHSIAASAQHLAVGVKNGIRLWRTTDWGEENWRLHSDAPVSALGLSADGASIAAGCEDGRVQVYQMSAPTQMLAIPGHQQWVTCVAFARSGKVFASGSYDGRVKIWEASKGRPVNSIHASTEAIIAVAFSHDSGTLATGGYDNLVRLWRNWEDSKPKAYATMRGHSDGIKSMVFSGDGRTLVTGSDDCTLRVWDVNDRQERFVFVGHSSAVQCADLSSDETLLVSGSRDGEIRLWRATKPEEVAGNSWKQ